MVITLKAATSLPLTPIVETWRRHAMQAMRDTGPIRARPVKHPTQLCPLLPAAGSGTPL